jgi:hypothetical protein
VLVKACLEICQRNFNNFSNVESMGIAWVVNQVLLDVGQEEVSAEQDTVDAESKVTGCELLHLL